MTLSTYAHLFDELADGDHRPAADQIREARERQKCPFCVRRKRQIRVQMRRR